MLLLFLHDPFDWKPLLKGYICNHISGRVPFCKILFALSTTVINCFTESHHVIILAHIQNPISRITLIFNRQIHNLNLRFSVPSFDLDMLDQIFLLVIQEVTKIIKSFIEIFANGYAEMIS